LSRYTTSISKFVGLIIDVQDSNRDAVVIISGDTGEGKSVFNWWLMREHAKRRTLNFNPVKNLIYDREEFNIAIDEVEEASSIGIDEAVGLFYSRDYHDDEQIALLKKLDRIRYRRLLLTLLIPNLFHIDKHIRDSRVRYWVHIDIRKGKGDSGYAHCYIFEKERNPFNPDPWNLSMNRKLFTKGKIDKSPNYLGEIVFKDISPEEYSIYEKIKDLKRKIAESKEWAKALKKGRRHGGSSGEKIDKRLNA
jgi:hypothetical protein